ncbi:fumarate hydratase [Sphingobacterium sp. SGL-16]|uniref:Fumarate hydratase n=1 Tax=Sphingobacterium litopenaei TaxID=2763500 RepID=A0ABR7YE43_9SPHI|nr:fumarate hydratase [Sphingobacterium litopenaei]NGM72728.1 fumarate hydratase [Sphingobacterium sp. SGL-16]
MIKTSKTYHFYNTYLSILIGMFLLTISCQRQSDMQTEGVKELQGVWVQDSVDNQDQLLSYTLHEFTFRCDSIYAVMNVHAKTKTIPDSCYKNGNWKEYGKGVYVQRGDSLIVEGIYTKANWKQKGSGCYKQGQYLPRFKIISVSADTIVLQNKFDSKPITLRKTQDITCVPKKRWEM